MPRYICALCLLSLAIFFTACDTLLPSKSPSKPSASQDSKVFREDPLRIGDRVRVEFSGIPDTIPPSEQDIKEDGSINLPYINRVAANGKSPSLLEKELEAAYVPAYYTHISVTVTPVARYFYVGGQVMQAGRILYTGPVTLMGAIEAAGDFTNFADRRHVQITRVGGKIEKINCVKAISHPELDAPIYPGDRIWVGRRF